MCGHHHQQLDVPCIVSSTGARRATWGGGASGQRKSMPPFDGVQGREAEVHGVSGLGFSPSTLLPNDISKVCVCVRARANKHCRQ